MHLTYLFNKFFHSEKTSGIILLFATILSLTLANLDLGYTEIWNTNLVGHSLVHWINDGLMTIFFLLIGLELEREIYIGELSKIREALLPVGAAIGGIVCPAFIYYSFNYGRVYQNGVGIPMATDIAFAIGVLALLGSRVPTGLKVFLVALAVIDDLIAILVIAFFYSKNLDYTSLLIALGIFALLLAINRLKIRNLIPYLIGGLAMWYFMQLSGVHATISGVLLAFAIPFGNGDKKSTSYILQHALHFPVAFIILPLFALANTAIVITPNFYGIWSESYAIGIALGLLIGKPLGVTLLSFLMVKLKLAKLPSGVQLKHIIGIGFLAAIGFTMSIFITMLAFQDIALINNSKLVVMVSSVLGGFTGFIILKNQLQANQAGSVKNSG